MNSLTNDVTSLRAQIDDLIGARDVTAAIVQLRELWISRPDSSTAAFLVSRYRQLDAAELLPPWFITHRLAIVRSFTVEPMRPLLEASAWHAGIRLLCHVGEFNTYVQELLDPGSSLYRFAPDTVILSVQTRDVAPQVWEGAAVGPDTPSGAGGAHEEVLGRYRTWIESFRSRSLASLVIHNLEQPDVPAEGVLDFQQRSGQTATIAAINHGLQALAQDHRGVYVLDYDGLVARHGRRHWHDERKWITVRLPIASGHLLTLAREWMKFLHPLTGKLAKVCVVDLDNTLWGGIIGEDGLAGIRTGLDDHRGAPHWNLQRALLDLHARGILLALASKNNRADVQEVFDRHPGMLVKSSHFAAQQINWDDKALNLQRIADELNVGISALAFVDDNPVERQRVRQALPEVTVLDLSDDPRDYALTVRESPVFQRLSLSEEDRSRPAMYVAERARQQLQESAASVDDFLRSLAQEALVAPLEPLTLTRTAQLTQKTNQFNLTTRRYSEQQLEALARDPAWRAVTLRVKDRYADNGLVGVVLTHTVADVCEIDTLLMSCRVIGRGIETALLGHLVERAVEQGCRTIRGWFRPTAKNAPCATFYDDHGFTIVEQRDEDTLWELDLASGRRVSIPDWIAVRQPPDYERSARHDA